MCTDVAPINKTNEVKSISDVSTNSSNQSGSSTSNQSCRNRSCSNSSCSCSSGYGSSGSRNFKTKFGVFHEDYHNLCRQRNRQPLNFFKLDPQSSKFKLRLCADKISFKDWELVLGALRYDTTLTSIHVQNRRVGILKFDNYDVIDTREKAEKFDRVPVILTRFLMRKFTVALSQCLSKSLVLSDIKLEALPMRADMVGVLCKALDRNSSLNKLSLSYCMIGDEGCKELCRTVKHLPNIKVLNLTGCGLSAASMESIVEVIKFQQLWRTGQCWEQGLRYQKLDPESISGLRRVTLNNNAIGDEGALNIINALADDNFIKAVDLQNCQLSEEIVPDLIELIDANNQLLVFDVRLNQLSDAALYRIFGQLQVGRTLNTEWRWIRAEGALSVWKSNSRPAKMSSSMGSISSNPSTRETTSSIGSQWGVVVPQVPTTPGLSMFTSGVAFNSDLKAVLRASKAASAVELTTRESRVLKQVFPVVPEQCLLHPTGVQDQCLNCTPAAIKVALDSLLKFASAAESVVGSLDKVPGVLVCHPPIFSDWGCGPPPNAQAQPPQKVDGRSSQKSVSFDLEKSGVEPREGGDAADQNAKEAWRKDGGRRQKSAVNNVAVESDDDSLLTLDGINADKRLQSLASLERFAPTSLTGDRASETGHGDVVCPVHPNANPSRRSDESADQTANQTSLKPSDRTSLPSPLKQTDRSSFQTLRLFDQAHQTSKHSDQTSLKQPDQTSLETTDQTSLEHTSYETSLTSSELHDANDYTSTSSKSSRQTLLHVLNRSGSTRKSSGQIKTSILTHKESKEEVLSARRQASAKSLARWQSDEKTGMFSGSDESILHAVFLGRRHKTKQSMTDASSNGSTCTVGGLSNSSSTSNATSASNSSNEPSSSNLIEAPSSSSATSSRATFVRLLLNKHSMSSKSQASNCNQGSSQSVGNSKMLKVIS